MRIASFADYLIDHIATLSLELNQAKMQIEQMQHQAPKGKSRYSTFMNNCERCLRMLKASRENLAVSIGQMVDQNVQLRRRHRRDREKLLTQNELIAQLKQSILATERQRRNKHH
jgi:hypothetical protein